MTSDDTGMVDEQQMGERVCPDCKSSIEDAGDGAGWYCACVHPHRSGSDYNAMWQALWTIKQLAGGPDLRKSIQAMYDIASAALKGNTK